MQKLVVAARSAAKRLSIFRGYVGERAVEWGTKSVELSLYVREHRESLLFSMKEVHIHRKTDNTRFSPQSDKSNDTYTCGNIQHGEHVLHVCSTSLLDQLRTTTETFPLGSCSSLSEL
jgi:hypothetical protein